MRLANMFTATDCRVATSLATASSSSLSIIIVAVRLCDPVTSRVILLLSRGKLVANAISLASSHGYGAGFSREFMRTALYVFTRLVVALVTPRMYARFARAIPRNCNIRIARHVYGCVICTAREASQVSSVMAHAAAAAAVIVRFIRATIYNVSSVCVSTALCNFRKFLRIFIHDILGRSNSTVVHLLHLRFNG